MKITIDEKKCIGCGVCTSACPKGIEMIDGVAKVVDEKADCFEAAAEICPIDIIIIK